MSDTLSACVAGPPSSASKPGLRGPSRLQQIQDQACSVGEGTGAAGAGRRQASRGRSGGGGRLRYDRLNDLPGLIPLWPHELVTASRKAHLGLIAKLRRALRAERQRGLAGHWTYNMMRHANLLAAYRAEQASLERLTRATARPSRAGQPGLVATS